ncbi:alanine racemase [Afifella sp. H1R]|uniref:alanine racemase n=1 Tax=Afifella sp. H1R TaxID=2908841 RepID=UPI001F230DF7|nr:alanine racemase [Afifella sp. H1R]
MSQEAAAGLCLTIDLNALVGNWRRLKDLVAPAECAGVVKADAYGTGIAMTGPALFAAGCRTFFVAVPEEGAALRAALAAYDPSETAAIYVLAGFFAEAAELYREARLSPVLGHFGELQSWRKWPGRDKAALHVDTGMNRLGLSLADTEALAEAGGPGPGIDLMISHLACADEPEKPLNERQRERFAHAKALLRLPRASLANSAGIHMGRAYHHELCRPGIALYGGASHPEAVSDPVVTAEARILQVRTGHPGETVGYGALETLRRTTRIAILSAGYADGYLRAAGSSDMASGALVSIAGHLAPLLGRISMDLISVDVTDIPEGLALPGKTAELFGPNVDIDAVARHAGTISYELLTNLSRRAHRRYIGGVESGGPS